MKNKVIIITGAAMGLGYAAASKRVSFKGCKSCIG
jgi:NAD(P)-dependent dehydrogenase (short-subunit alcohol dehydrogenase family)